MKTTDGRKRRKRVHHAAASRVLSGGLTASATLGIVAALASTPATAGPGVASAAPATPARAQTPTAKVVPRKIVRIVRRHLPPASAVAPGPAIPAARAVPSGPSPVRSTRVARRPAPAAAVAPAPVAPTPATTSNGSR